ncbi:MAG TPA: four helix bundle protein [Longimicrobiales bacterium]|nr:four helix bundle protein [Longimicrobiales bacterium]
MAVAAMVALPASEHPSRMPFLHCKLDVFQLAVEWVLQVQRVTVRLPREWWWMADQLRRASGSIPLNTAEGSARPGTATERKYYNIARDSAAECDACVVILHRAG